MNKFRKTVLTAVIALGATPLLMAQNTTRTVNQVTESVTLSDDVDYIVTNTTPFGDAGVVDIANTDNAVLILSNVKPSAAIPLLANHVTIAGAKAANGTNCQVKLHNLGSIILPHGDSFQPLTVYSEQNFEGTALSQFNLGHSGGYMNTLSNSQLNNQIRSFKLKRGYMVTFSTQASGRGYSRCFIAADKDLEVATLPTVLDRTISSYRIFKWYDAGKKQLANSAGNVDALKALNVQSTYDWGQGNGSLAPDIEWVANHIYEDWPSSSAIGSQTQSPHTKNNNEPKNTSDDRPQDLSTILNNWENMMRTGLRLCSPASWDGSDYWNATGFLAEFLDSIDARGWRCDIIDLHCYWPESNFGNVQNWANKYKRPIWISEWCWGASWSSNGAFANGVTEGQVRDALSRICSNLNSWDCVERYYYWNGERDPSRLYKNGALTPAGQYYASMNSGLGYNGKYDFVPRNPRQYAPSNCTVAWNQGVATVKWADQNGEYNQLMQLQRRPKNGKTWETIADIAVRETASTAYSYKDEITTNMAYRVRIIDVNGKEQFSNEATTNIPVATETFQFGTMTVSDISASISVNYPISLSEKPAVILGSMSLNNKNTIAEPYFSATSITKSAFTYVGLPWTSQPSGTTTYTTAEELPYLIIPFGNYHFGTMDAEVGTVQLKGDTTEVLFEKPFPEDVTPVVVASISRSTSKNPITHHIWDVTNTGFKLLIQFEGGKRVSSTQYFSYMAVTPGYECVDADNGLYMAAGRGGSVYGSTARAVLLQPSGEEGSDTLRIEDPIILADLQTDNAKVPAVLRLSRKSTNTVKDDQGVNHSFTYALRMQRILDKSNGTPTDNKNTADTVGWIALHTTATYDQLVGIKPTQFTKSESPLHVTVENGVISVEGNSHFELYTINGTRVAPHASQTPGIYLVRAGDKVAKVLVK